MQTKSASPSLIVWTLGVVTLAMIAAGPVAASHGDTDNDGAPDGIEVYGGSNAADPLSKPESLTMQARFFTPPNVCTDGLDNDLDGLTDALDSGCLNSDADMLIGLPYDDAYETKVGSDPFNAASKAEHWFLDPLLIAPTCTNSADDDGDGLSDASDPGCMIDVDLDGFPAQLGDTEGLFLPNTTGLLGSDDCGDGEDNDGDGLTDLADPDCVDNDGDGLANTVDSEGPQGLGSGSGVGGSDDCYDGVDNDNDGFIDAAEPSCGRCYGFLPTISGGLGPDVLIGTAGPDVIMGFAGDDRIIGGDGNDYICAGPGNDKVNGGSGDDYISGSEGNDQLVGAAGVDEVTGDAGDDKLVGSSGADTLLGGIGNDRLAGGADDDYLQELVEPSGDDVMRGGSGNDNLFGGGGDDDLRGGGGDDILLGRAGTDFLRGGGGNDTITGGDDGDNLAGNGGVDFCDGQGSILDVASASCETIANVP